MAVELTLLEIRDRQQWRKWLDKNHAASPGVWLVFHKNHTGKKSIAYQDSLHEALCFGWVDSLVKRLDEDRFARKFTPRKPDSKWSDINRKHWAALKKAGLLAPAGLAAAPTENRYGSKPAIPDEVPAYIVEAFQTNPKASAAFQAMAPSHRRHYFGWIHMAKRPETREKRIREAIGLLAAGKKLGLK
jgi:uncharacterized protein YdeI (YjbR/CyaY-like superfamily)